MSNKITFTDEEAVQLGHAVAQMAVLWNEPMSDQRLDQYIYTLTVHNTRYNFTQLMRSIVLARTQDHHFPMPADILQRELRAPSQAISWE